jgi:nucleotide-binding universal stress UspA family protein
VLEHRHASLIHLGPGGFFQGALSLEIEHRRREEAMRAAKEEFLQIAKREQWLKCELGAVPREDIGDLILSRAADNGADLIVMGAYGHSRLRELVLGGATRTLFESMTVPTLMSH